MERINHNQQILAFCAYAMGFRLISGPFGFYYVKVFLNFYHIEEKWFQSAQILFLIWNTLNDPLFAYCQDNYQSRFTRTRRESILYGAPFFALSFLTAWFPWGSHPVVVGVHLIVTLFFWDTMFTFIGLASCCLFTEISQKESDRYKLTRMSQFASLLGSGGTFILEHTSNSLTNFTNFQITAVGIATVSWLLMHYCGKYCDTNFDQKKINATSEGNHDDEISKAPKETYWTQTCQILRDKNFLSFVFTNFLQELHKTFLVNFMAIIGDQLISTEQVPLRIRSSFYGSAGMLSTTMLILFMPWIAHYSYKNVIRASFLWKIGGGAVVFFIGRSHPWILMLFLLLDRCFAAATFSLFNMPLADIADANMRQYDRKHPISSMVFGTNALITKPAISLSPMFVVAILNRYGYDKIKKETLTSTELEGLRDIMFYLVCFFPVIVGSLQLAVWSFYTLKKKDNSVDI